MQNLGRIFLDTSSIADTSTQLNFQGALLCDSSMCHGDSVPGIGDTPIIISLDHVLMWLKKIFIMSAFMMTSSHGNIFRVTGHLCGEFTSSRWIPRKKGQWRGALMFSLICVWINGWVNNSQVGDLRRHHAHYDVIVMLEKKWPCFWASSCQTG